MIRFVKEDWLPKELYNALKESFPELHTLTGTRSMHDMYSGQREFQNFVEHTLPWRILWNNINSAFFWSEFFEKAQIQNPTKKYPFWARFKESKSGAMPVIDSPFKYIDSYGNEQQTHKFLYARMDISLGLAGYGVNNGGRGVHIDNKQRILSGLLYFTDQREVEGGEFCFCTQDGSVTQKISLKENLAIISSQDKEAWHFVNPLTKGYRRFVYFSLNATWNYWDR